MKIFLAIVGFFALSGVIIAGALTLWLISLNSANQSLQRKYKETLTAEQQKKTDEIKKGTATQQVGTAIIKNMGEAALKNDRMKNLLHKHGIEVRPNATPAPVTQ